MAKRLTQADVARLLADPSAAARAETAAKIAAVFERSLTPRERAIAEEIFRLLARDVEIRVRAALSARLKDCDKLPHDIAAALARDVASVALPMLQHSKALTEDDLVEIARSQEPEKQRAIAARAEVPAAVAETLVEEGCEEAVAGLMANPGAELPVAAMQRALDRFAESEAVTTPMARRPALPLTVAERLVSLVSEALREELVGRYEIAPELAGALVAQGRERATVALLAPEFDDAEAKRLAAQLHRHGRLTPSLLLRALLTGDTRFFEAGLACLAGLPLENARTLIHDRGPLGLRAIFDKAAMPEDLFAAVRTAVDVVHETDFDGGPGDRERFRCRVMERILTQFEHLGAVGADDLDYVADKLAVLKAGTRAA